MERKKIITLFLLIFVIGFVWNNACFAQDLPPGWEDQDPAAIPIPGAVYFLIAALGLGAKKLYDVRKKI